MRSASLSLSAAIAAQSCLGGLREVSRGFRALIGNCFWPPGALARSLTDRKSTSNRNDLARAVSIHQVPAFQILGL